MKTTFLLLFLLTGCGSAPFLQPSSSGSLVQSINTTPVDCHAICLASTTQLERDFGVLDVDCDARVFLAAHDCRTCGEAFRITYGVEMTTCP